MFLYSIAVIFWIIIIVGILSLIFRRRFAMVYSPRILYFYIMSFISLLALCNGIAILISLLLDIVRIQKFPLPLEVRRTIAQCLSLILVALPIWLFHWRKSLGKLTLTQDETEIRSEILAHQQYHFVVLGLSSIAVLVFITWFIYQIINALLAVSSIDWSIFSKIFGYGVIGLVSWSYHWFSLKKGKIGLS